MGIISTFKSLINQLLFQAKTNEYQPNIFVRKFKQIIKRLLTPN